LLLAAVFRAAWRSRGARGRLVMIESLRAGGDEEEDKEEKEEAVVDGT
jgi:hypothetical protein